MDLAKWLLRCMAALLGVMLAVYCFFNFEFVEIKSVSMMPDLQAGQRVLVKRCVPSEVDTGDLVLYDAPVYDFDTQYGLKGIRRVSGKKDGKFRLSCSPDAVYGEDLTLDEDKIWGKVILWEKKNAN